ncbi:MAG: amino acid permease, partial [Ferruginibacter sp.]
IMLCYAEAGSRVTKTGGSYAYVEAAFGPFAGFIINWVFFFAFSALADAALMNITADSLAVIFPVFTYPWVRGILYFILIAFMVLLNIRGAKQSINFIKFITIAKLLPLLAIIVFGFFHINSANLHWENLPSIRTFGSTALVLFFAFFGFESALSISGEIKNPQRTIPRGIGVAGIAILIIYLLLQVVTQGVLGTNMALYKDAPLAAIAETMVGPVGGTILLLTAAFSCFSSVSGDVLSSPRLLFSGAQDGIFPPFLAKLHPKFATPYWAIISFAGLIFLLSISGSFKQLAVLASASISFIYLAVVLATIKLRRQKQELSEKTFRMPGGLMIPFIAIAAIVWLLASLSLWEVLSLVIFVAVVCVIYMVMKTFKKSEN